MHRLASFTTHAGSTPLVAGIYILGVGWSTGEPLLAAIAAAICIGIPAIAIVAGIRRGRIESRFVPDRTNRVPLAGATIVGIAGSVGLLSVLGADTHLIRALVALGCVVVIVGVASIWWKISAQCSMVGLVVGSVAAVSPVGAIVVLLVGGAVAWSRVYLGAHTWAQTLTGLALGSVVAAAAFTV